MPFKSKVISFQFLKSGKSVMLTFHGREYMQYMGAWVTQVLLIISCSVTRISVSDMSMPSNELRYTKQRVIHWIHDGTALNPCITSIYQHTMERFLLNGFEGFEVGLFMHGCVISECFQE